MKFFFGSIWMKRVLKLSMLYIFVWKRWRRRRRRVRANEKEGRKRKETKLALQIETFNAEEWYFCRNKNKAETDGGDRKRMKKNETFKIVVFGRMPISLTSDWCAKGKMYAKWFEYYMVWIWVNFRIFSFFSFVTRHACLSWR